MVKLAMMNFAVLKRGELWDVLFEFSCLFDYVHFQFTQINMTYRHVILRIWMCKEVLRRCSPISFGISYCGLVQWWTGHLASRALSQWAVVSLGLTDF